MTAAYELKPLERDVLRRLTEARAAYLMRTGNDLLWADLGRHMGWTQAVTSRVKNALRPVMLDELPAVAEALGVRVEWLAFGSGPMREGASAPARGRAVGQEPETVVAVRPLAPAKKRRAR